MSSQRQMVASDAEFDRSNPLFERARVPCEFLCGGGGHDEGARRATAMTGSVTMAGPPPPPPSRNVAHYTVRILSGRRPIRSGGGSERVVRFEVSDECSHFRPSRRVRRRRRPRRDAGAGTVSANAGMGHGQHHQSWQQQQQQQHFSRNGGEGAGGVSFASPPPMHGRQRQGGGLDHNPPVMMQAARQPPPAMQGCPSSSFRGRVDGSLLPEGADDEDCRDDIDGDFDDMDMYDDDPIPSAPIHLYELEVGETDFADLRRDQALLVDFADFASSFISLLGFCDLGEVEEKEGRDLPHGGGDGTGRGRAVGISLARDGQTPLSAGGGGGPFDGVLRSPAPHTPYSAHAPRYSCRLEDFSTTSSSASGRSGGGGGSNNSWGGSSTGTQPHGGRQAAFQARFSVVESNQFRELTHLSLHLAKGTDASIRSYLSARLRQSMAEGSALRRRLTRQVDRAEDAEASCREASSARDETVARVEAEKRELRLAHAEEVRAEADRVEARRRAEADEREAESKKFKEESERKRGEVQDRADALAGRVEALTSEKTSAEAECDRLRNALKLRDESIASLKEDVESVRDRLKSTTEEKEGAERSLHQTQLRVAALEQSNESQERALAQADALREAAASGEARANESAEVRRGQLGEIQNRLAEAESENVQLREALERYRADRKESKRKMRGKIELIREQEDALAQREAESSEFQRRMDEMGREVEGYRAEVEQRDAELREAKAKLSESAKLLESNQQVITWLNKEINEAQLGRTTGGGSSNRPIYGLGGMPGNGGGGSGSSGMPYSSSSSTAAAGPFGNPGAPSSMVGAGPSAAVDSRFNASSISSQRASSFRPAPFPSSSSIGGGLPPGPAGGPAASSSRFGPLSYVTPSPDYRVGGGSIAGGSGGSIYGAGSKMTEASIGLRDVTNTRGAAAAASAQMPARWPPSAQSANDGAERRTNVCPPREAPPFPPAPTPTPKPSKASELVGAAGARPTSAKKAAAASSVPGRSKTIIIGKGTK